MNKLSAAVSLAGFALVTFSAFAQDADPALVEEARTPTFMSGGALDQPVALVAH